ncbi:DNA polymerase III subunit delta', partial [Pseudomonas shirazensis]
LVSHQPSRLLPTIKSRCQQVVCPQPNLAQSQAWLANALPDSEPGEREELLTLAAGSPLMAAKLHAQGVLEQRAQVTEGVKKLLKQQQSPTQLAESWNSVPLLLLFDWFFEWSHLILRYQMTQDERGLGLADM